MGRARSSEDMQSTCTISPTSSSGNASSRTVSQNIRVWPIRICAKGRFSAYPRSWNRLSARPVSGSREASS